MKSIGYYVFTCLALACAALGAEQVNPFTEALGVPVQVSRPTLQKLFNHVVPLMHYSQREKLEPTKEFTSSLLEIYEKFPAPDEVDFKKRASYFRAVLLAALGQSTGSNDRELAKFVENCRSFVRVSNDTDLAPARAVIRCYALMYETEYHFQNK